MCILPLFLMLLKMMAGRTTTSSDLILCHLLLWFITNLFRNIYDEMSLRNRSPIHGVK